VVAQKAGWPEIPRRHLKFGRHGHVEDEAGGRFFSLYRGEIDAVYCAVVAYYMDEHGYPVFLEPPPGPKTRAELEAREAAREQRRNSPSRHDRGSRGDPHRSRKLRSRLRHPPRHRRTCRRARPHGRK
jgi:hypothetical protein